MSWLETLGWGPLIFITVLQLSMACPKYCSCKWKNGKQTVECTYSNLSAIPDGIDGGTQVLDLSGNELRKLPNELFLKKQLTNLQRIYMSNCRIKVINDRTFKGLTNLIELDLSHNLLDSVPTETFLDCPSLMRLILNSNPIKHLRKFSFNHLSYLNTLEINNCELSIIDEGAFQGLHSLEWLHLSGNKLRTIRGRRTLPENLKGVDLQGNNWECDCHIHDLHAWLRNFNVPLSVEPTCNGPQHLVGRIVKSIPLGELACLPDISPTTFYLEIGEGKNVSLLCHVHAIPEATVSWWFQGQVLQNNTSVAPGVHLIYFLEEGAERKRSELFIYNTNAEDNGTFICNAENAAGASQSNFTIRIILKKDPIVIIVSFPFEYLLASLVAAVVLGLVIITIIIISILRCRRKRKRQQKTEKSKEVTLQYQQNDSKSFVSGENADELPDPLKVVSGTANGDEDVILYGPQSHEELFRATSPVAVANNQVRSPSSLRRYQLEQNPDLINGTESIGCRREGDGEDVRECETSECGLAARQAVAQLPVACLRGTRDFYKDVRCKPACVVDPEGYPIDYGLPKIPCRNQCIDNYYRTLPCNRMKRQSAANPISRYSREAEFLSRTQPGAPYDHYEADVRYTADGYPVRTADLTIVSQNYRTDTVAPSSLPCCSVQWPACVPANLHMINPNVEYNKTQFASVSRRCVSAQTDTESENEEPSGLHSNNKTESITANARSDPTNETLTESPDEGYEGEPGVV